MTFKRVTLWTILILLGIPWASAEAGWRYRYRRYAYPVYVVPAPVYVQTLYGQPVPVYVQPRPVYVQPVPVRTQLVPATIEPPLVTPRALPAGPEPIRAPIP